MSESAQEDTAEENSRLLAKTMRPTVRRSLLVINLGVISILCNDAAEKQQLLEEELAHLYFC